MSKEKPNYYAILTADVRYDRDLNFGTRLLYAEITALSNLSGTCWASDDYFMKLYEVSKRTVQSWLKSLEDKGYINRNVVYKNGTKEIEKRYITLTQQSALPYSINMRNPIAEICVDSTTSTNTTSNNIKTIVEKPNERYDYSSVIDYLNEVTGYSYRNASSHQTHIRARYKEGYTLEDFKQVIDTKSSEWKNDKEYSKYLRPSTLFGNKFDNYLNENRNKKEHIVSGAIFEES